MKVAHSGHNYTSFMVDTSAIDEFLGATLRAVRAGEAAAWPAPADTAWQSREELIAIWERIEYHGIPVLLHTHADRLIDWPAKMLARIAEEARLISLWEATHQAAIKKLITAIDAAGITAVLMKGTAIAYSLHEEPAARRRGDSDLLIQPTDLDAVRQILTDLGWYLKEGPHGLTHQEAWRIDGGGQFAHFVDLHWQPSDRAVLQKVLTNGDFFASPQPLPRLATGALRADHLLTLIHETLNQKWHLVHGYEAEGGRVIGSRRLIWSVDFDLMMRAMRPQDWARLVDHCEERKVGPLIAEALRGAAQDLAVPLPAEALGQLEAQILDPDIASFFETTDTLDEFWLNLRSASSWREKFAMLVDRGFPPRRHLVAKYPDLASWPTVLLQARMLIGTAGRVLRRASR